MRRRDFVAGLFLSAACGCDQGTSHAGGLNMPDGAPNKIRLIPDNWHIKHVGRLADGRLFWVDEQLDPAGGATKDFVCTFIFDQNGRLNQHSIELIEVRGTYLSGGVAAAMDQHLTALGPHSVTDIWVCPFSVESNGAVFGLIPRRTEDGDWRVEFMPGNTLSFYPPWEAGEYDT